MNPLVPEFSEVILQVLSWGYVLLVAATLYLLLTNPRPKTEDKILWLLAILLVPIIGLISYFVVIRRTNNATNSNHSENVNSDGVKTY